MCMHLYREHTNTNGDTAISDQNKTQPCKLDDLTLFVIEIIPKNLLFCGALNSQHVNYTFSTQELRMQIHSRAKRNRDPFCGGKCFYCFVT